MFESFGRSCQDHISADSVPAFWHFLLSFKEDYWYHSQRGRVLLKIKNSQYMLSIQAYIRDMRHPYLKSLACRTSLIRWIFHLIFNSIRARKWRKKYHLLNPGLLSSATWKEQRGFQRQVSGVSCRRSGKLFVWSKYCPILEGFLSYSHYHCHHATIAISHLPWHHQRQSVNGQHYYQVRRQLEQNNTELLDLMISNISDTLIQRDKASRLRYYMMIMMMPIE